MATRDSKLAWLAVATLAIVSIAGGAMVRMKATRSSPAAPSPSSPVLWPEPVAEARRADASIADAATSARPSSASDGGVASPSSEAALLSEIEASVSLGRIGHARSLADRFYRTFPRSPAIPRIERLTGYHPRPYGPRPR
jgi:hypothetical protein